MHCTQENGSDLHVNERQKIRTIVLDLLKKKKDKNKKRRMSNHDFLLRSAYVNCTIIAILYTHSIGNEHTVVFKVHDSVPTTRYSCVCNVLHLWKISLFPTYRVYQLYGTSSSICLILFCQRFHKRVHFVV